MNSQWTFTNPSLKNHNRLLILKLVCTGEARTRSALVKKTLLSKMAVTNIVNEFIDEKILCEVCEGEIQGRGRKPMIIEVSPDAPLVAGVFLGRDDCSVVLCSMDARILKVACFALGPDMALSSDLLLEKLYAAYTDAALGAGHRVLGIGIASLGPIDKAKGVILNPPDFYGLSNIDIKTFLEGKTGLPVFLDNDMNASALAEKMFGHGKSLNDFIYMGVLRGMGVGIILDGRLVASSTGIFGGIGHASIKFDGPLCPCGNRGCLELYTSLPIIVKKAAEQMRQAGCHTIPVDWSELVSLARENDYYALKALDEFCDYLALGIVNLVNIVDCGEVFLGNDVALAEGLIEKKLEEHVNRYIFSSPRRPVRIRMSAFGQRAPLVGSVCLVLNSIFQNKF